MRERIAGPRGRSKPLQIAVDSVPGTTGPEHLMSAFSSTIGARHAGRSEKGHKVILASQSPATMGHPERRPVR